MLFEPFVRYADQISIKTILVHSRFATANQKNCFTFDVEGKSNAPFAIDGRKTQLLHIRIA